MSVWYTLWEGGLFRDIWVGLLRLLRNRGISADEAPYRSAVNATELQLVPRGKGYSVWWKGASCYWWVAVRGSSSFITVPSV